MRSSAERKAEELRAPDEKPRALDCARPKIKSFPGPFVRAVATTNLQAHTHSHRAEANGPIRPNCFFSRSCRSCAHFSSRRAKIAIRSECRKARLNDAARLLVFVMDTLDCTHGLSKHARSSRIEQSGRNHSAEPPFSPPNKEVRQKSPGRSVISLPRKLVCVPWFLLPRAT